MKKQLYTLVGFMLLGGSAVFAMLPPDASLREPQLRRERMQVDRKYEKKIAEMRVEAVQRHRDVSAGLDFPPWKLTKTGAPKPGATIKPRARSVVETSGHNLLAGLTGLLAVGGLFCLIKRMTREADNR